MKTWATVATLSLCCFALAGCAASRYSLTAADGKTGFKNFEELTDDEAMEAVALIHNVRIESKEDEAAKNLTIDEFNRALDKRKSKRIKDSGVLQLEHGKVDLAKWPDDELMAMFCSLQRKAVEDNVKKNEELTKQEKGLLIIHKTAKEMIAKEGKKREKMRSVWNMTAQALLIALSVAVSCI